MKMMRGFIILAAFLPVLSACAGGGILKSTEPRQVIYTLRPAPEDGSKTAGAARIVEIAKPQVPPGFETDRIALYTQGGKKLDYYAGAKWADLLDSTLQDTLRRSARNVLPSIVAITSTQGMDGQFRLQTKVNEFAPVYADGTTAAPTVRVSVEFTLVRLPDNVIVSSFILGQTRVVEANSLDAATGAMEEMMQQTLTEAFRRMEKTLAAE